ncbi:MAG TPA: alpha/beta fold hydrolase [Acetobacteraceae bacterium]|nr:alpha/beta fold hydrolase [Acetobacteraceae bacterium]
MAVGMTLAGCAAHLVPAGPDVTAPSIGRHVFVMPDGTRLPYLAWLPPGRPQAVMLALHGFNDSRDAFAIPAPLWAATGIAVYAPDQRGFGAAFGRGYWPGTATLVDDARTMAGLLRAQYPQLPLYLLGESMGGAVLTLLGASPNPPPVAGYILAAPAVWSRTDMNIFFRSALWLGWKLVPGLTVSGAGLVKASDNRAALVALGEDPLTILDTRIDTVHGLVDLMTRALDAAPRFHGPALILYGAHDQLVPKRAMAAMWRSLPKGAPIRLAYYAHGYHLLLRDHDRGLPIGDIIAWIRDPHAPLPSGADRAARAWLAAWR